MRRARRGGRAQQALTAQVLAVYGRRCWLRLPGCTKVATTKDHVVPYSQGGTDDISNFRPACRPCNSRRQDRTYGPSVRVVTGPPAAGKSTYVNEQAHPLDIVIDLDRLARALVPLKNGGAPGAALGVPPSRVQAGAPLEGVAPTGDGVPWENQGYPDHVRHVAIGARQAAIQRATRLKERVGVWIIHSVPNPQQLEEYKQLGWEIITIDPGETIVKQRISAERTAAMSKVADKWYELDRARSEIVESPADASRDWGI